MEIFMRHKPLDLFLESDNGFGYEWWEVDLPLELNTKQNETWDNVL